MRHLRIDLKKLTSDSKHFKQNSDKDAESKCDDRQNLKFTKSFAASGGKTAPTVAEK